MRPHIILSIAGSDPSGGAGIQADIKTISALGGYAAAAITALTVQNTLGVQSVTPVDATVVSAQVRAVMDDLHPHAIKIGMTGSGAVIHTLADLLQGYTGPVVLDPVMASTSGHRLMDSEALGTLRRELLPCCTLVTPNLPETQRLLGRPATTVDEMKLAAQELGHTYGCAFLIKGGHLEGGSMCDVLYDGRRHHLFTAPRIHTANLHGTGCTLSSAIATCLAQGHPLPEAVSRAKSYISQAIEAASHLHIGEGNGPLWHFSATSDELRATSGKL